MFNRNWKVALKETLSRRSKSILRFTLSGFSDQQDFVCCSNSKYRGDIQPSNIKVYMFCCNPKSNVKIECKSHKKRFSNRSHLT